MVRGVWLTWVVVAYLQAASSELDELLGPWLRLSGAEKPRLSVSEGIMVPKKRCTVRTRGDLFRKGVAVLLMFRLTFRERLRRLDRASVLAMAANIPNDLLMQRKRKTGGNEANPW